MGANPFLLRKRRDTTLRANSPAFTARGEPDAVVILPVERLPGGAVVQGDVGARRAYRDPTVFRPAHGGAEGKPLAERGPRHAPVGRDRRRRADVAGLAIIAADDHAVILVAECD